MEEKELANVLETLLSVPGMSDPVKIDMKLPRKTVLLLAHVLEKGLTAKKDEKGSAWSEAVGAEQFDEIRQFAGEALQKANLTELSDKLKKFQLR